MSRIAYGSLLLLSFSIISCEDSAFKSKAPDTKKSTKPLMSQGNSTSQINNQQASTSTTNGTTAQNPTASGDATGPTGANVVAVPKTLEANANPTMVKNLHLDWPNVIECRGTGAGSVFRQYFYLAHIQPDSQVVYSAPYTHNGSGAGAYGLVFNPDKSWASTLGG